MSAVARHARIGMAQATAILHDSGRATVKLAVANDAGASLGEVKASTMHPDQLGDLVAALTTIWRLQEQKLERARQEAAAEAAAEAAKESAPDREELEPHG